MPSRVPSALSRAMAVAVLVLAAAPCGAAEVTLTAEEIGAWLAGNSVTGEFRGSDYVQYFDPSGDTLRANADAPAEAGKWKTDPDKDLYCSWWAAAGWRCYIITRDGDTVYWQRPEAAERTQSTWAEGNLLNK